MGGRSLWQRYGRGRDVVHLIAILFFAGLLVGLAMLLQLTVREHWHDMVAALLGRPLPSRQPKPTAVRVVARRRLSRHAAA